MLSSGRTRSQVMRAPPMSRPHVRFFDVSVYLQKTIRVIDRGVNRNLFPPQFSPRDALVIRRGGGGAP
jgi:hypothetical protein